MAVEVLLQRLRGEGGRDIADIINAAAAAGGSISREEIYVLCDYRDDRMLRGITRPAARITANLQSEGILPPSVAPMMKSV
ncbi:hypothetical protein AB0J80_12100 [Actinoplanes sp. NPDC049548]|uniref:hypothetical protein n=1 Tax=Actinoplanes sp. NPDC049548 TaxID=3155152 RepID=UPI0034270EDC